MTQRTKWALIAIAILILLGFVFYRPLLRLIFHKQSDGGTPVIIKGGEEGGPEPQVVFNTSEYTSIGQNTLSSRYSSDTLDLIQFTERPFGTTGAMKCLQSFSGFGNEIDVIDIEFKVPPPTNTATLKVYEGNNGSVYIKYAPPIATSSTGLTCSQCQVTSVSCVDTTGKKVDCNKGNLVGPWIHINHPDPLISACPP